MTDKNLIDQLFDFEQIYTQIQNQKRGVLYKAISLLEPDQSKAEETSNYFGIKSSSNVEDDFGIAYDNIGKIYLDIVKNILRIDKIDFLGILSKLEKPTFAKFCLNLENKKQMEIIVFTAFILISGFAFVKWRSSTPNQRQKTLPKERTTIVPTAICLAVPASAVFDLTTGKTIDRNEIIQLIDSASDFLCTQVGQAETLGVDFDINQSPSPDSQLKFYIRIDIPDGQDIIDKKTKYVIKRDLPPNTQGQIKELGRLRSISSISSFNRI